VEAATLLSVGGVDCANAEAAASEAQRIPFSMRAPENNPAALDIDDGFADGTAAS